MRKNLLFVILILSCLNVHAQEGDETLVSIAKKDWTSAESFDFWFGGDSDATIELVDGGLAITNPRLQEYIWNPQTVVLTEFTLEEGHDYVVRLTMKVPSDGTYWVNLGSWDEEISYACQFPASHHDGFQVIDVEYPEYGNRVVEGCHVIIGCGWVVGTTIIQEVELLERTSAAAIRSIQTEGGSNNAIYNLSGQRVGPSYKGVVIQNGRKIVK